MSRLTIRIDPSRAAPAYRQVADAIRPLLVDGRLKPGDALPPVRQLAIGLGVHFNTIAEAYRSLAAEGWIELKRRRGALVIGRRRPPRPSPAQAAELVRRMGEFVAAMRAQGVPAATLARELRRLAAGLEPEEQES
jgi:GntR family transcriptional regulator